MRNIHRINKLRTKMTGLEGTIAVLELRLNRLECDHDSMFIKFRYWSSVAWQKYCSNCGTILGMIDKGEMLSYDEKMLAKSLKETRKSIRELGENNANKS